jgi:hypothetical protein
MYRSTSVLLTFLATPLLALSFGCGGPPASQSAPDSPSSQGTIELTKEIIDQRINDTRVWDVMPESGTGEPISWSFDEDEPKEIAVVEQQIDGLKATIILDIKTQSAPRANNMRHLAGQVRTHWQLRAGWVLRRWEIVGTENISMKYRDVPKAAPLPQNANR